MNAPLPEPSAPASIAAARPLVSVCVSAYNVESYVREALESILGQSYRELEVIVVDNGSDDGRSTFSHRSPTRACAAFACPRTSAGTRR